jgi:ArsR family transcriptional regulator
MIVSIDLFKALSDETRLKIVELLLTNERCVCEITPYFDRTQSTISIQLNKLERLGILARRREGKRVYYRIKDLRICDLLKAVGHPDGKTLRKSCCMKRS